ncbi:hypothetical protein EVAR_92982_1 [Eumeta japonica]|uniref:Uncharacterized protein n=1 Tax=Eumeta variegata TaxID=151549 RepID=A0A4C1TBJ9_EUMVA|nr:hypothetical protein EVAR_92982_1 [Eumeta japonica]
MIKPSFITRVSVALSCDCHISTRSYNAAPGVFTCNENTLHASVNTLRTLNTLSTRSRTWSPHRRRRPLTPPPGAWASYDSLVSIWNKQIVRGCVNGRFRRQVETSRLPAHCSWFTDSQRRHEEISSGSKPFEPSISWFVLSSAMLLYKLSSARPTARENRTTVHLTLNRVLSNFKRTCRKLAGPAVVVSLTSPRLGPSRGLETQRRKLITMSLSFLRA